LYIIVVVEIRPSDQDCSCEIDPVACPVACGDGIAVCKAGHKKEEGEEEGKPEEGEEEGKPEEGEDKPKGEGEDKPKGEGEGETEDKDKAKNSTSRCRCYETLYERYSRIFVIS
jgi:hypothetical protein